MLSDRFAPPSALYHPPALKPSRLSFVTSCIAWGVLLAFTGLALCAVLFMAESLMAP